MFFDFLTYQKSKGGTLSSISVVQSCQNIAQFSENKQVAKIWGL